MNTKFGVAIKSALRALIPVIVLLLTLISQGVIKSWRDLLNAPVVLSILAALGVKGAVAGGTAKNVQLR